MESEAGSGPPEAPILRSPFASQENPPRESGGGGGDASVACAPLGCGGPRPGYRRRPAAGPPGATERPCRKEGARRPATGTQGSESWFAASVPAKKKKKNFFLIRKRLVLLSTLMEPKKNKGSFPANN